MDAPVAAVLALSASPRFLDAVIALVVAELAALVIYRRLRRRGMPIGEVVAFLGAGLALLVALRSRAQTGSGLAFGAAMTVALVCHVWHVRQRWQR